MAIPVPNNRADFCFRFRRYSWRETYWDSVNNPLTRTLEKAKTLAPLRIAMLGCDTTVEGSPQLERIVVSNDAVRMDSDQTTEFQSKTPDLTNVFLGEQAAPPEWAIAWRTTNFTGFGRTRYLSGVPLSLFGQPAPHRDPNLLKLFKTFAKALDLDAWAYLLSGAGPNKNPDNKISFIGAAAGFTLKVYAPVLPNLGDEIEIRYARFVADTPAVRGTYKVLTVEQGFFTILVGELAPAVQYKSSGIWRKPATRVIRFDSSALMTGVTTHHRGFKLHLERGRSGTRKAQIF